MGAVSGTDPYARGAGASSDHTLRVVQASDSPLPTGSATAAKQDTGNTSLASLDTKLPAKGAAATAASTPVNIASDQVVPTTRPKVGAQGNAWNAAAVLAAGVSAAVDTSSLYKCAAFGVVDAATTITVQVSEDNATFYDTTTTVVLGGAGDFHVAFETVARYVRLKSSAIATITATIAAKG